jgi:hypothetical protein
MPERPPGPRKEITKEPPEDSAAPCLLCAQTIAADDPAVRTHGIWVHRACYEKDIRR